MNRIVKEHYPVEKLPADLREGLPLSPHVRITIEVEPDPQARARLSEWKSRRRRSFASAADVNAYVRELRGHSGDR